MDKKIIKSKILENYEILSDDGWKDVKAIHKTIDYEIYILKTNSKILECADNHIVFLEGYKDIYVKDLKVGNNIITKDGIEKIIDIKRTGHYEEMYDLELDNNNYKYYTNDILSHNTFYIRHLLSKISETDNVLYFPPTMVNTITDPGFVNFINTWVNDNEKSCILLIEDAEPLLVSRDHDERNIGITNLLNLTDGLLNDIFGIKIICTFNTSLSNLDKALLRPERLLARKEFIPLTKEKALILADKIKIDKEKIVNNMTLADIYSIKKNSEVLLHDVGTSRKTIGF